MKKKIVVNAMGKRIVIDNPENISIAFSEKNCKPFVVNLKINKDYMKKIIKVFKFFR